MINSELQKFIGHDNLTVFQAMQRIDANEHGILIITSPSDKLIGSLSDGDVRRYLLSGGRLEDNVTLATNKHLKTAYSYDEAVSLFHKKNYIAIPLVDENRNIVSIYLGNERTELPKPPIHIPVVINAGGKGTRLEPYTKILPKPLIPVGELPIIEHIMRRFQEYDCQEFHIIVNYKKQIMKGYFAENEGKYNIIWHEEEKMLGTGGGLTLLKGKIHETFFFTNCDNLLMSDYDSVIRFHKKNQNIVTMICAYKNIQIPYGVVEMGMNGSIEEMKEKPQFSFLTNTGIYVVEPEVLEDMEDGIAIGFPDVVGMQIAKGRNVAVYPVSENEWLDMGQLPELERMRKKLYGE